MKQWQKSSSPLLEIGVTHLARYADHSGDAFETLRLAGKALVLPTSLLIDKDGCEIGVVAGPANRGSAAAVAAAKALQGGEAFRRFFRRRADPVTAH